MTGRFGPPDDPYAAGCQHGYLIALSDVAAEIGRLPDVTSRSRLQQLLVELTTQMRFLVTGAEQ